MWERIKRLIRHRWLDDCDRLVDSAMVQRLKRRVASSEALHTGEIRICIECALPNSYLLRPGPIRMLARQRALSQFGKLRVWDTENNNGVLVYLLLAERCIEVVADRGLNQHVTAQVWQTLVQSLGLALREGRFEDGLGQAVDELSALLQRHFPIAPGQVRPNELPDQPAVS